MLPATGKVVVLVEKVEPTVGWRDGIKVGRREGLRVDVFCTVGALVGAAVEASSKARCSIELLRMLDPSKEFKA